MNPALPSMRVLGVRIDDIAGPEIARRIVDAVAMRRRILVVNANANLVTLAHRRRWLRNFFDTADIAFCDGAGVQLACSLLHGRVPSRSTPPEWVDLVAKQIAPLGGTVYWLGGTRAAVEKAAAEFTIRTGTRCVGFHDGYFDMRTGSSDNAAIVADINRAMPDLLILNMGMPRQEQWLRDHWDLVNARAGITAGALVDHVAGQVHRPPRWVANMGVEWAIRLAREPKRLWRRYLIGLPLFGFYVLRERLMRPLHQTKTPPGPTRAKEA